MNNKSLAPTNQFFLFKTTNDNIIISRFNKKGLKKIKCIVLGGEAVSILKYKDIENIYSAYFTLKFSPHEIFNGTLKGAIEFSKTFLTLNQKNP